MIISIHAPARGATKRVRQLCLCISDFNPRTRTGCDDVKENQHFFSHKFQSTHPHGVRLEKWGVIKPFFDISIHAPARGATCFLLLFGNLTRYFNPRTRTGCDSLHLHQLFLLHQFQSTHPHGVRLVFDQFAFLTSFISIHAPARGATSHF